MRRGIRRAGSLCLVLALSLAVSPSVGGADDKDGPYATKNCTLPRVEPTRIVLACGDAGFFINAIDWKYWGNKKAKGSGVAHAKVCRPSCAAGQFHDYPVKFKLYKVRSRICNGRRLPMFQKIKMTWPGQRPPNPNLGLYDRLFCF